METEQAHSVQATEVIPRSRGAVPAVWLNLVCLDAPLVAVAWLWLFGRTLHIPLHPGNGVALFLTAWLIYLADRLADSVSLKPNAPRSLRQEFCLRHREIWIATIVLVAGFDAYVIWRTTAVPTFLLGVAVGSLALLYLVINHPLGLIWRSLPAKELVIGSLFTAGTLVALTPAIPSMTSPFVAAALAFAALCALNCISIARWEWRLDRAQGKVSIVTRHPTIATLVNKICATLAFVALALTIVFQSAAGIFVCIGISALLLMWLNTSMLNRDARTALADLVLLTPIIPLIAMAL